MKQFKIIYYVLHTRIKLQFSHCLHFIGGKIECDRALSFLAILEIAKESNSRVQSDDDSHANIQDAGATDEVLRSLHVVFQRHHLKT